MDFISPILDLLVRLGLGIVKKTPWYKSVEWDWSNFHIHKRLYSYEKLNRKVSKFDFNNMEKTWQLDGRNIERIYGKDMKVMDFVDSDCIARTVKIPYLEIINFNKNPDAQIDICCSTADPLFIDKGYALPKDITNATKMIVEKVINFSKTTHDGLHTRLASLKCVGPHHYECVLEQTSYFKQISSNLSVDCPINIEGQRTTVRGLERERHEEEVEVWKKTGIAFDALHPECLTSLENSLLANVIGVSAIWCMGDVENPKIYLMPRNKKVGVYRNNLGMPSGDIELPNKDTKRFSNPSLIEFLKWEIAREFAEETGLRDKNRPISGYSIKVDTKKAPYEVEMEIIPLAFVREMYRGGKPQMFFLIRTEEIPIDVLKECFLASLGKEEFDTFPLTTASLSAEVACNYLYALQHLQRRNKNDEIYLN